MDAASLQLPVMPTSLGVNQQPTAPAAPAAAGAIGKFLTQPFTGNVPGVPVTPGATPTPAAPVAGNTYIRAPTGILGGGPVAPPAQLNLADALHARAAFDARTNADAAAAQNATGADVMNRLATTLPSIAAPKDPQSGQIRFIDQNSPRVVAQGGGRSIDMVRGGAFSGGSGGGLTNQQADSAVATLPPRPSAAETANHGLLNITDAFMAAHTHLQALQAAHLRGEVDDKAVAEAQAAADFADETKNPTLARIAKTYRSIGNQGLGTVVGERQDIQ